ncbi:MAG TPA: hypothetical protein PKK56_01785 [archaeon]|jgi:esterase/lipase superfamily enzyme|nr:hypothetical protein [archaeon]HPC10309.1 hypothetical protein [archaeon]HRT03003.1 hypothetical protein [Candidatus Diapherotrites archaeon]
MNIFNLFRTKHESIIEIDANTMKEVSKLQNMKPQVLRDYRNKPIDWLINHLQSIQDVVEGKTLGTKQQSSFYLDGKKVFKNETTRAIFNDLFDNYNAYYYALKRYISVRKQLEDVNKLKEEEFLAAGREKEILEECQSLERQLNTYANNITNLKIRLRQAVYG